MNVLWNLQLTTQEEHQSRLHDHSKYRTYLSDRHIKESRTLIKWLFGYSNDPYRSLNNCSF